MNEQGKRLQGMSADEKRQLLQQLMQQKRVMPAGAECAASANLPDANVAAGKATAAVSEIPASWYQFEQWPGYQQLRVQKAVAEKAGITSPYFQPHDGVARDVTHIHGREMLNFSTYNYLNLCGDGRVNQAAIDAIATYGTSASASRVVSGERPVQRQLEQALAELIGAEAAVVYVSGHATNVTTIGHLFGPRDLILHDQLIHNSALVGALLSRAHRRAFGHNNWQEVEAYLAENRHQFERVLVVVEGIYSMDGDIAPVDRFVEIRNKYKALLMVDEAHSMGVLGATGAGVREHFGLQASDVDIWMGTLSKSFASAGGYIAGSRALVEYLKFTCPGFVYSVGIAPPLAAASLEAIRVMQAEPERVQALHENGLYFREKAKAAGLNVGLSDGYCVVPVILGSSVKAALVSNRLFEKGINVQPIIHPAVEEKAARLRFFISSVHRKEQMDTTIAAVVDAISGL